MYQMLRNYLLLFITAGLLLACGESEAPQEKITATESKEQAVQVPAEAPVVEVAESVSAGMESTIESVEEVATQLPAEVPDIAEVEAVVSETLEKAEAMVADVTTEAEAVIEEVAAVAGDKPYQLVDGKISENAMNGWRTYNGGGCGACHGKGGIDAVCPKFSYSLTKNVSKKQFKNIVINGVSVTMMRPHKTNKRVMDNLDDLYVYLLARGDGVLGPGNLIKQPLGK